MKPIIAAFLLAFLFGCTEPTIDSSSDENLKTSIEQMKQGLTEEQKAEFEESTKVMLFANLDVKAVMRSALRGEEVDTSAATEKAMSKMHGLTVAQINLEADRIREERRVKEIAQIKLEISELEDDLSQLLEEKEKSEQALAELAKVTASKTKLYWQESRKYSYRRKISLNMTIHNGLDVALSRVYMTGTLSSPGRSVPWLVENFNYQIAGGLEPGESQTWALAPNSYSGDWNSAPKDRNDVVFTVVVNNADGPGGEKLFDLKYDEAEFERKSNKLAALKEALTKYDG